MLSIAASPKKYHAILFSDQIVDSANATMLINSSHKSYFVSALEVILSLKYRYQLIFWHGNSFTHCAPGSQTAPGICEHIAKYFAASSSLGDEWRTRKIQALRTLDSRRATAKRKLALFTCIAMNAYRHELTHPEFKTISARIGALERAVEESFRHDTSIFT